MRKKLILRLGLGGMALGAIAFGAWILTLPAPAPAGAPPPVAREEAEATLAALKPPKRQRPVIAIVGINEGTETTDYLMPYGILARAGIAEVMALATRPGPVTLYPALTVQPQATIDQFDTRHADGADYVIVPAMRRDDDPAVLQFLRRQSAKGATIIGVCAGAKIVAAAGFLDGRRATTHWYYLDQLLGRHPAIRHVADRRLVVDSRAGAGVVATTTGITASLSMSLTLIEAIAGRAKAEAVARDLGVADWDARHRSDAFRFTRPFAVTALVNALAFWGHEDLGLALAPGMDEVALALVADAWSRTYRSRAVTFAATAGAPQTRHGLHVLADKVAKAWPADSRLPAITGRAQEELDKALGAIADRYGARTRDFVAMQMEYPKPENAR